MKFLKILLWIIGTLFLIYLILCFMGPKKFEATATTTINAPADVIFEEIADFGKHPSWSPWHQMDADIKNVVMGTPGTVGHKDEWVSKKMGDGSQEIVEIRANEYQKVALRFKEFDDEPSWVYFNLKPNGEGTETTWSIDGGDYPFLMRGMSFMMPMQKIFEQGVANLKKIAEAKPAKAAVVYEIIDIPAQWYVGKRFPNVAMTAIDAKMYEDAYTEIGKAIGGMDKAAGMPMGIAHGYDGAAQTLDLEIAIPVAAQMKVPAGLNCVQIPAGRAAKHIYHGAYEEAEASWNAFSAEVKKSGHKERWAAYEVYANDPTTVSSPAEYETWLIQPIE